VILARVETKRGTAILHDIDGEKFATFRDPDGEFVHHSTWSDAIIKTVERAWATYHAMSRNYTDNGRVLPITLPPHLEVTP
jgi:hypothetical protein